MTETWGLHAFVGGLHGDPERCVWTDGRWSACKAGRDAACHAAGDLVVDCDDRCGAPLKPESAEELRRAVEHWRDHRLHYGCSHGR